MTYDQLHAIAEKHGTVKWDRSGIIEHLWLSKNKKAVIARPIKQSKCHVVGNWQTSGEVFHCIEVDSSTKQPLEEARGT